MDQIQAKESRSAGNDQLSVEFAVTTDLTVIRISTGCGK